MTYSWLTADRLYELSNAVLSLDITPLDCITGIPSTLHVKDREGDVMTFSFPTTRTHEEESFPITDMYHYNIVSATCIIISFVWYSPNKTGILMDTDTLRSQLKKYHIQLIELNSVNEERVTLTLHGDIMVKDTFDISEVNKIVWSLPLTPDMLPGG